VIGLSQRAQRAQEVFSRFFEGKNQEKGCKRLACLAPVKWALPFAARIAQGFGIMI